MKYKNLPFVFIENKKLNKKDFKKLPFTKILIDIFNGNLWSSKVSFVGNVILIFLIIISSIAVVLATNINLSEYNKIFHFVYLFTSVIFTFEITARIVLAGYLENKYMNFWGKVKYLISFYCIIDILSILPFLLSVIGIAEMDLLRILMILRLWRFIRFLPGLSTITNAFKNKKEEILVSFFGIFLLSVTISTFIYHVEILAGNKNFNNILSTLAWSIGKYTNDYGGFAGFAPVTAVGRLLATLNGFLGIALFVVPAGLLGTALIDEIGENKHKKQTNDRIEAISKLIGIGKKRFLTLEDIQTKLLYAEDEIFQAIRNSNNLRFRAMKSAENIKYNDIKIIERFIPSATYGSIKLNHSSKVFIINPMGATERCISHFTRTIANTLGYNYISREYKLRTIDKDKIIYGRKTEFYLNYNYNSQNPILPKPFHDFMNDIKENIKEDNWVIVINSAGSGFKNEFHFTYENEKGSANEKFEETTIQNNFEKFKTLHKNAEEKFKHVLITKGDKSQGKYDFIIGQHEEIDNSSENSIGKMIFNNTTANVITLWINIKILTDDNDKYNAAIKALSDTLEATFGNNKEKNVLK